MQNGYAQDIWPAAGNTPCTISVMRCSIVSPVSLWMCTHVACCAQNRTAEVEGNGNGVGRCWQSSVKWSGARVQLQSTVHFGRVDNFAIQHVTGQCKLHIWCSLSFHRSVCRICILLFSCHTGLYAAKYLYAHTIFRSSHSKIASQILIGHYRNCRVLILLLLL